MTGIVQLAANAVAQAHPMGGMQAERIARAAIAAIVSAQADDRTKDDIWQEMTDEAAKGPQ